MNNLSFEEAMKQLEEIVKKLESGSVTLDESMNLYKSGLELSQFCYQKLQVAEKLIVKVNED